jgi:hypothetical protein
MFVRGISGFSTSGMSLRMIVAKDGIAEICIVGALPTSTDTS